MKMIVKRCLAAAVFLGVLMIAGCGGSDVVQPTISVSIGQQLIDLKKARDTGALSEKDYLRQKDQLIDRVQ